MSRDAYALAERLRQGRGSATEAVTAALAAIESRQADLNALTEVFAGAALAQAAEADARLKILSLFFRDHDVLVTPTMQMTAFPVGRPRPDTIEGRPVDPVLDDWCAFCLPANLAGLPATSVPAGSDGDGMPIGLQVIGPRWADALTLRVAAAFEAARHPSA